MTIQSTSIYRRSSLLYTKRWNAIMHSDLRASTVSPRRLICRLHFRRKMLWKEVYLVEYFTSNIHIFIDLILIRKSTRHYSMAIRDARVNSYVAMFRSQHGVGYIPVYQGLARYQSGQGFSDFFRGLLRRVLPSARNVGKSALSAMADAEEHGASFADTQVRHLTSCTTALRSTVAEITKAQDGSGLKERTYIRARRRRREKPIRLSTTFFKRYISWADNINLRKWKL